MTTDWRKVGTGRFKGSERLAGSRKWNLRELLVNLEEAIHELEAERIEWAEPSIEKFRRARQAVSNLISVDGRIGSLLHEGDQPPRLSDWSIFEDEYDNPRLKGLVYGHPLLTGTGRPIYTSLLLYVDLEQGFARTLSRFYMLGGQSGKRHDA
ncbi:DUF6634 family protein [Aliihoeflea sp. 2WW]|jgi:hypothetical protein|uniref:DUF6634 family protein n=1 Tax=Aliihoeflea sp. 2WW TaxID=1381123 RepID=UPI001267D6D7|nr:DUF6634 family protein [Aliihoeflea sp. 2WW]